MARIPIYEQRLVPNASAGSQRASAGAAGQGMAALARGLDGLAGGLDKEAQVDFELEQQSMRIERERIETEGRIWAARAASQTDLDMAGHLQEHQKSAKPGAPGFTPSFLKSYDEYTAGAVKNAPSKFAKNILEAHVSQSREAYGRAALMWEAGERTRFTGQQIDEGVGMSATMVHGNPAWFDREMGKWASTIKSSAVDEAIKQKLMEGARKQLVNAAVVSWIDRAPAVALATLKDIAKSGDSFPDVTWNDAKIPVKLGTLEERLRWTDYADRKLTELRQDVGVGLRYEIQNAEAMARTGTVPAGPERTRAEFALAFKDPATAEHEYARYMTARGTAVAVASLSGRSTADLVGVIQTKPDANDPNFAVTAGNQAIQAQAALEIVRARRDDPMAYALQTGDFKLQPLNPQDPKAFAEELKRRSAALPGMAEKYGIASMLSKPEATALARNLEAMPAEQKIDQLERIRGSIADDSVYAATLNSIRPDSPVTALVGNIVAAGARDNARMIARGEDLLNPTKDGKKTDGKGSFPMPTETLLRQAWVDAVGDAYRGFPDAEATAYQGFKAYYAASAAQKGLNDPKASPDDGIVRAGIAAATGGVARWKTDWFGNDTPSANIVLPYGVPEDQFKDRATNMWLRVREDAGYPKTGVGDIGLYNTGENGKYMVMSGSSWLPSKTGHPVILDLSRPIGPPVRPRPKNWEASGASGNW